MKRYLDLANRLLAMGSRWQFGASGDCQHAYCILESGEVGRLALRLDLFGDSVDASLTYSGNLGTERTCTCTCADTEERPEARALAGVLMLASKTVDLERFTELRGGAAFANG